MTTRDVLRRGRAAAALKRDQPPVTLMWRDSAGRLWRRSMTKSWPLGLREIASWIAAMPGATIHLREFAPWAIVFLALAVLNAVVWRTWTFRLIALPMLVIGLCGAASGPPSAAYFDDLEKKLLATDQMVYELLQSNRWAPP